MIFGVILIIAGCVLVLGNQKLAVLFGEDPHRHFERISSSVARMNIAIIGAITVVAGLTTFFLF